MRPVQRQIGRACLRDQLPSIGRNERELRQRRPARHRRKREQVDPELRKLRQEAIRRAQFVANVRVVVLDGPNRECHRSSLCRVRASAVTLAENRAAGADQNAQRRSGRGSAAWNADAGDTRQPRTRGVARLLENQDPEPASGAAGGLKGSEFAG